MLWDGLNGTVENIDLIRLLIGFGVIERLERHGMLCVHRDTIIT